MSSRKYHKDPGDSSQRFTPEDQSILIRFGVIAPPDPGHGEAKPFIQAPGRFVRSADLERRAAGADSCSFLEDKSQQRGRYAGAAILREYRQIVDVQFVEDPPERAEPDGR